MALSNAEKQARWRERHIEERRNAQRIVNLLVRKDRPDDRTREVASLLHLFFNTGGIAALRRALKPKTDKENKAGFREVEKQARKQDCALWLREHPDMTAKDYRRLPATEVLKWRDELIERRKAKAAADVAAERQDWEREHPGVPYPEYECSLSGRELTDLNRWRRQRQRTRATGARATA
jgi:hypothetical protein